WADIAPSENAHARDAPKSLSGEKRGPVGDLAAVRGGHLMPAPAGRPHGPRRCGGPEHHGVLLDVRHILVAMAVRRALNICARTYGNQQFLNHGSRITWIKVNR